MKLVYYSTLERNPNLKEKYLKIVENKKENTHNTDTSQTQMKTDFFINIKIN